MPYVVDRLCRNEELTVEGVYMKDNSFSREARVTQVNDWVDNQLQTVAGPEEGSLSEPSKSTRRRPTP